MFDVAPAPRPTVSLAPMEGVTNFAMRLWQSAAGAPAVQATPFLRVTATYPHLELPEAYAPEFRLATGLLPYQLVPQLMAADADEFVRAAELVLKVSPFVDLNCGCPSPTCTGKGAGSSLLRQADEFGALIHGLASRLGAKHLAIKVRAGYASDQEFPALLAGVADLPLARLAIHGRTRPAGYQGFARWDLVGAAAKVCAAPVVGSGDVVDFVSYSRRLALSPGLAGVMVGRGALRNPWIFLELATQQRVTLEFRVVLTALVVFALLSQLHQTNFAALVALVQDGQFAVTCGTDGEAWERHLLALTKLLYGRSYDLDQLLCESPLVDLEVTRQTMGRAKMVWNYARSSLPEGYFEPTLLRQNQLNGFLRAIWHLHRRLGPQTAVTLTHQAERDWLYAGARKEGVACATSPDGL